MTPTQYAELVFVGAICVAALGLAGIGLLASAGLAAAIWKLVRGSR